jgi:glycosyltransferase involved in cell wall biosynthesis
LQIDRKKILFVIDNLEFGGGERVFLQLATALKNQFQLFVASMPGGRFQQGVEDLGLSIFPVDMSRQLAWKPIRQLRDIIRKKKIDLIHSQGARADFYARVAGKMAGVTKIICTVAMPVKGFDVGLMRKGIYRLLDQLSGHFVQRFIVVSDSLKKTLIENHRVPHQRVVRIYNGIEVDQYHPDSKENASRNQWAIPPAAPLIGAIGRMVWQKGFKYLIRAVPEILEIVPEARFLIVGDGPLRSNLQGLVNKLGVCDKITLTGFRSDIQNLISTFDILVVPSLAEGFPMITLEAMAMSKPLVATQIQGIIEQISDGVEGILVPPKAPKALGTAVLSLLQDRKLASRLGAAARSKVEACFSVEKMVEETEKVYLSVLKANEH